MYLHTYVQTIDARFSAHPRPYFGLDPSGGVSRPPGPDRCSSTRISTVTSGHTRADDDPQRPCSRGFRRSDQDASESAGKRSVRLLLARADRRIAVPRAIAAVKPQRHRVEEVRPGKRATSRRRDGRDCSDSVIHVQVIDPGDRDLTSPLRGCAQRYRCV